MFEWKNTINKWKGEGIYHLTFTTMDRQPILGELKKKLGEDKAYVKWSHIGSIVLDETEKICIMYPSVKICAKQIMPDHLHIILWVTAPINRSIKEIARGFVQGCKRGVGARILETPYIRTLAHPNQLKAMIAYVHDNPRRALEKKNNPAMFQLRRDTRVSVDNETDCISHEELLFSSMGNHYLLDWPDRQMIECSRTLTQVEIDKKLETAIEAAKRGVVSYMAVVSEGERLIAKALRQNGYPLVILMQGGFPKEGSEQEKYYKPGGVYFDACSKGKLLLLEPRESCYTIRTIENMTENALRAKAESKHLRYTPIPTNSQRWRFVATNVMAKLLADRIGIREGQMKSAGL